MRQRQERHEATADLTADQLHMILCFLSLSLPVLNYGANRISSVEHLQILRLLPVGMTIIISNSKRMFKAIMTSPLRTTIRRSTTLSFLYCSCSSAPTDAASGFDR